MGPSSSKNARPMQELESRVLLFDLVEYGKKQTHGTAVFELGGHFVPEDHWFSIVNKFVSPAAQPLLPLNSKTGDRRQPLLL